MSYKAYKNKDKRIRYNREYMQNYRKLKRLDLLIIENDLKAFLKEKYPNMRLVGHVKEVKTE